MAYFPCIDGQLKQPMTIEVDPSRSEMNSLLADGFTSGAAAQLDSIATELIRHVKIHEGEYKYFSAATESNATL